MKALWLTGILSCVILLNANALASNTDSIQIGISVVVKETAEDQRCHFNHLNELKIHLKRQISNTCDLKYAKILKTANQLAYTSSLKTETVTVEVTVE